jgi:hypothetical protein
MKTEQEKIIIPEFEEMKFDDEFCHFILEPFTHSLCGIYRNPEDRIVEATDKPDCPICVSIWNFHTI